MRQKIERARHRGFPRNHKTPHKPKTLRLTHAPTLRRRPTVIVVSFGSSPHSLRLLLLPGLSLGFSFLSPRSRASLTIPTTTQHATVLFPSPHESAPSLLASSSTLLLERHQDATRSRQCCVAPPSRPPVHPRLCLVFETPLFSFADTRVRPILPTRNLQR